MIPTHLKVGATLPKLRNYLSSRHREPSPPPSERSNLTIDNLPPISKLRSTLVDHPQTYLLLLLDFHLLIWWSELMCWIYDDQRTNQHSKFPQHRPFSEIPQHQLSNSLNNNLKSLFPGADNPGTSIHLHKGDRLNAKMVHALYIPSQKRDFGEGCEAGWEDCPKYVFNGTTGAQLGANFCCKVSLFVFFQLLLIANPTPTQGYCIDLLENLSKTCNFTFSLYYADR